MTQPTRLFIGAYVSRDRRVSARLVRVGQRMTSPVELTITANDTGAILVVREFSRQRAAMAFWRDFRASVYGVR